MADTIGTRFGEENKPWDNEQDTLVIRQRNAGVPFSTIAKELGRTKSSVISRYNRVLDRGIASDHDSGPYSSEEKAKLIKMYIQGSRLADIRDALNRSVASIQWQLGLLRKAGELAKRPKSQKPKKATRPKPSNKRGRLISGGVVVRKTFDAHSRAQAKVEALESYSSAFFDRTEKPHMAGITLEMLGPRSCRYACNDADLRKDEQHLFCGAKSVEGKSYCPDHLPVCETLYARRVA